jgi:hypothetical protein
MAKNNKQFRAQLEAYTHSPTNLLLLTSLFYLVLWRIYYTEILYTLNFVGYDLKVRNVAIFVIVALTTLYIYTVQEVYFCTEFQLFISYGHSLKDTQIFRRHRTVISTNDISVLNIPWIKVSYFPKLSFHVIVSGS